MQAKDNRFWDHLHNLYVILAIIGLIATIVKSVWMLVSDSSDNQMISSYERATTAIVLGLFSAAGYGIVWSIIERIFKWKFGPGIGGLPKGLQAVALSFATTIPLSLIPPVYELLTSKRILSPFHYRACIVMIIGAALGHVLLYGTRKPRLRGLRDIFFPFGITDANWFQAIRMEVIYAFTHFISTVFTYQLAVHYLNLSWSELGYISYATLLSALIFFFGASGFVTLKFPESIVDPFWAAIRGVVNGIILMIAMCLGILM